MTPAEQASGRRGTTPGVWTVLTPKWRAVLHRLRSEESGSGVKYLLLALVALGFWSAAFGIAFRVLRYFRGVAEIGDLLAQKVLGVLLLAFLAILLLSSIITALSSFFLAKDLDLLVSAPIRWSRLYLAKLTETVIHSSWMVALLALPIFTAYGIVYEGGPLFPVVVLGAFIPLLLLPGVVGAAVTQVLVNIFPARRTRDLLSLVAIGGVGAAVLVLRVMQPEQLARPEGFRNLVDYLVVLRAPTNPLLPSEWAAEMIMNWLRRVPDPAPIALLWGSCVVALILGIGLHRKLYPVGYSKAQEGAQRRNRRQVRGPLGQLLARTPVTKREFILKDLRVFFRDNTQWSQLILIGVLLLVYLINIKSLPLFSGERVPFALVTIVVFLNLGLAGFVLAAVAARFLFPALSLEGRQMWLLRSSPLEARTLLWSKYWIGTVPLLVLAIVITSVTNLLLAASPIMMVVSLGTIVLFTLAASALALTYGIYYPQFGTENAAQIPTSFGGLVFMMTALGLLGTIITIEAWPLAGYLRAQYRGQPVSLGPEVAIALTAVAGLCLGTTLLSLRLGLRRLETMEL